MLRSKEIAGFLIPALREVGRRNGYALAVHGSLERDIDVVAVPWTEGAMPAQHLAEQIHDACRAVMGRVTGPGGWSADAGFDPPFGSLPKPQPKPHGRLAWSILFGGGPYLDLSVMPLVEVKKGRTAMNFTYKPFAEVDSLAVGEATIHRARSPGAAEWWNLWFWVIDAVDGQPMPVAVPIIPDGSFTETGPGGRSWGLSAASDGWRVTPSVNVLNDGAKTVHPGEHTVASHWHDYVTLVGVPSGSAIAPLLVPPSPPVAT